MAHIERYKASQVVGLLEHNARTDDTRPHNHSNEDIDTSRTKDNYELCRGDGTAYERYKARMEQVHCMKRDDVTVLDSLIVTLPKDVAPEDERAFFESCYAFAVSEYGDQNVINATVHKDETTPHIHIGFIPVVEGKRRNGEQVEKVKHTALITREYLEKFHTRLSDYIGEQLGYKVAILNGATANGNKKIQEMKAERAEQRANELEGKVKDLEEALTAAEADTKETKTVKKGLFGKEKEVPKTEEELQHDKEVVAARLAQHNAAKAIAEAQTQRELLASNIRSAVALERQEADERQRRAVLKAKQEEQNKTAREMEKLRKERDLAVKLQQQQAKELTEERQRSDAVIDLAMDYAYLCDEIGVPENLKELESEYWSKLQGFKKQQEQEQQPKQQEYER